MGSEPPPLPSGPAPETPLSVVFEGRLHPLTLLVLVFNAVRNFLIPAVLVLATGSEGTLGLFLLLLLLLNLATGLVKYFTFHYRIQGGDLITRQGILERRERQIPLERVQDLRLEQGLFQRMLGVVEVEVETAGGQGSEASLSVLSRPQAEALRQAVFAGRPVSVATAAVGPGAPAAPETIYAVSWSELVLEGLSSNRAASALVVLGAGWQFLDDLVPRRLWESLVEGVSAQLERWVAPGGETNWLGIGLIVVCVVALSALFSVAGSILLFHGFTLRRLGNDLQRVYGLVTRRSSSLPRRRIQLLKVEEPWLRRWMGLATLRADTAGGQPAGRSEERSGRDVLCPVLPRGELDRVVAACMPDYAPAELDWKPVARCAIRRGTFKAAFLLGVLALVSVVVQRTWWSPWPLLLIPLAYAINVRAYAHLGYMAQGPLFRLRQGWLNRSTHLVPIRNVQAVTLRQTPWDRRYAVWTLVVDTAGQSPTGGGPRMRNVPASEAQTVAREVARRAARLRYQW